MQKLELQTEILSKNDFVQSKILLIKDSKGNSFIMKHKPHEGESFITKMIDYIRDNKDHFKIKPMYELLHGNSYRFILNDVLVDYSIDYAKQSCVQV